MRRRKGKNIRRKRRYQTGGISGGNGQLYGCPVGQVTCSDGSCASPGQCPSDYVNPDELTPGYQDPVFPPRSIHPPDYFTEPDKWSMGPNVPGSKPRPGPSSPISEGLGLQARPRKPKPRPGSGNIPHVPTGRHDHPVAPHRHNLQITQGGHQTWVQTDYGTPSHTMMSGKHGHRRGGRVRRNRKFHKGGFMHNLKHALGIGHGQGGPRTRISNSVTGNINQRRMYQSGGGVHAGSPNSCTDGMGNNVPC